MTDGILTTQQAAKALQITELTLTKWLRAGRMQGTKVGKSWRIPEDEVRRVLDVGLLSGESRELAAKDDEIENLREENRLLQEEIKELRSGRSVEPKRKIGERTDAELLMKAQGDLTSLQNLYDGLIERYRDLEADNRKLHDRIEELETALAESKEGA